MSLWYTQDAKFLVYWGLSNTEVYGFLLYRVLHNILPNLPWCFCYFRSLGGYPHNLILIHWIYMWIVCKFYSYQSGFLINLSLDIWILCIITGSVTVYAMNKKVPIYWFTVFWACTHPPQLFTVLKLFLSWLRQRLAISI